MFWISMFWRSNKEEVLEELIKTAFPDNSVISRNQALSRILSKNNGDLIVEIASILRVEPLNYTVK